MKRWRWDAEELQKPIRWPVTQEREVQDILWLILRSYFPDVVDEDALPKLGHSTYKADFGIGSLKLIIEAKFATSKDDFKKIEKEIQEDCIPYLRDLRYEVPHRLYLRRFRKRPGARHYAAGTAGNPRNRGRCDRQPPIAVSPEGHGPKSDAITS